MKNKREIAADMIGKYCIVRTHSAGVHAGIIKERAGNEIVLTNARRIWYWSGAATLSQLALQGTNAPQKCKFPAPVPELLLINAIEIIPMTPQSITSIESVPAWTA